MGAEFPVRAVLDDRGIDKLIAALTKAGRQAGLTEKEIGELRDELRRVGNEGPGHFDKINKSMNNMVNDGIKKVGTGIIAAFAIDKITSFIKEVVSITAEFQKFSAVLTNTLGSRSAAKIAMKEIQEFAAKTPFSVKELTESFVKLANQGFVPTREEMRKLGDLASSTGKTFDQLAEAILDAQSGEFERLKEFGIRTKKQGDLVTFTFKGVETQTRMSSEAIQDYILSLGDAIGVSGSMAAISDTLGGQISNLGDAFDTLMNTLGDGQKGVLKEFFNGVTQIVVLLNEWAKTEEQIQDDKQTEEQKKAVANLKTMAVAYGSVNEAATIYLRMLNGQLDAAYKHNTSLSRTNKENAEAIQTSYDKINVIKAEIEAVNDYVTAEETKIVPKEKVIALTKAEKKALEELREEQLALLKLQSAIAWQAKSRDEAERLRRKAASAISSHPVTLNGEGVEGSGQMQMELAFYRQMQKDKTKAAKENAAVRDGIHNEEFEKEAARIAKRQELEYAAAQALTTIVNAYAQYQSAVSAKQLSDLEKQHDYEISLAGDNTERKQKIDESYDKKKKKILLQQAQRDRDLAVFNATVNTAAAFVEALPNYVLAGIVAVAGLAQIALIEAAPLPAYKDGVFNLDGPGTATSDSITLRASKGETITPAAVTQKFGDILEPMVNDPSLTWQDLREIVDNNLPELRGDLFTSRKATDTSRLEDKMDEVKDAILNKQEMHLGIDENGFTKWTKKGAMWTEYVGNRYTS